LAINLDAKLIKKLVEFKWIYPKKSVILI